MKSRWFIAALLLSIVTAAALIVLPTRTVHEGYGRASLDENSQVGPSAQAVSLWTDEPTVAFVLAIPVLACALPLLVRRRHRRVAAWVSVTALVMFVLLGLASVGLFFLPGVILTAIGAVQADRRDS